MKMLRAFCLAATLAFLSCARAPEPSTRYHWWYAGDLRREGLISTLIAVDDSSVVRAIVNDDGALWLVFGGDEPSALRAANDSIGINESHACPPVCPNGG